MRAFKIKITGLLLILFHFISVSQTLRFENFTTKNGLVSDEVYNLYQDKKGYIWAFTNYGAVKYNSVEFKQVLKNLPFDESFVYSFYENKAGRKWLATSNDNIYEVINDSAFQVKGTDSVSRLLRDKVHEIGQLYVDDQLRIYAMTKSQSYLFTPYKDTYKVSLLNFKANCDTLLCEVIEADQTLLPLFNVMDHPSTTDMYGRPGKVYIDLITKKDPWTFELDRKGMLGPKNFKKFNDKVYFSYHNRLGIIHKRSLKYLQLHSYIIDQTKDKNGHLWVGCYNGGLYELNEKDSVIHHYFDNITINDVLIDSQNGLWASSTGHGLFHCSNVNNRSFEGSRTLKGSINILKKIDDALFVGDAFGDVYEIKNSRFKQLKKYDSIVIPSDIIKVGADYVISSSFNTDFLDLHRNYLNGLLKDHIMILSGLKLQGFTTDSVFYMVRRGICLAIKGEIRKKILLDQKANDFKLRNNVFLVATEKGVYQYSALLAPDAVETHSIISMPDSLRQFTPLSATVNSKIKEICTDARGNFWFCSAGNGLFLLDTSNLTRHYTEAEGLPSNIINNVCFDNDHVFLSTNKGLFYSNTASVFTSPGQWKCIYTGNVQKAVFFENKIYLSTHSGLTILTDINLEPNLHFNLASVSINAKQINAGQLKQIRYYQNNIEFQFDLICFNDNAYKLKYVLSGPYNDSRSVTDRRLNFQHLPPGDYTLTAQPDVSYGDKLKITLRFCIIPAFWQTPVFFALMCLLSGALVAWVGWLMFKNYKKRQDKKITAEKLILEYKLIALKAQINPHFVSNCLTAIQHLIIQGKSHAAADYIAKFGFLVRQILNFSTRSLVTIKEELQIAQLNIELEQLRFENKFNYAINIDPAVVTETVYVPALILNPIIENSIWHGLIPLKNKRQGSLLIHVKQQNGRLLLVIEDNGVGRQLHSQSMSNIRESKGIKLIQQRLTNINYLYNIELSEINYEDLYDAAGNPTGTRVVISLPTHLKPATND